MVIVKDPFQEEELKNWIAPAEKKREKAEEKEIAEGVIFVAFLRDEADRKWIKRLI